MRTCASGTHYMNTCGLACNSFDTQLPLLLKANPYMFYNHIYPSRGPKIAVGYSPR